MSSVTLSPLPFPRDGDHGPLPPDMAGSPRGCLRERSPTPGPPPPRRGPPPGARPLPATRRAGKAPGPGDPPAPRPRGEGAGRGLHTSLLKAFTASMSRRRREPGGFSPLMAAGPGRGREGGYSRSVCACAPRSGAAGPPRHGGWRRGRARRDAGPGSFPSPPGSARPPRPASRPAAPTSPPPLGSARPRRQEMEEQRAAAAARAPIWRTHGGSSQRSSEKSRERRRRLQRHLPGGARPPGRATEALTGWRSGPPRPPSSAPAPAAAAAPGAGVK